MTYSVIMNVWNEAENIQSSIQSLLDQTMPPVSIIVADDGSTDNTTALADNMPKTTVVHAHAKHDAPMYDAHLAYTINAGLDQVRHNPPDYIAISGGDLVYPPLYFADIIARMGADHKIAAACGQIQDDIDRHTLGGFRTVNCAWWMTHNMRYPLMRSFESWLPWAAHYDGMRCVAYDDLILTTQRPTGSYYQNKTWYNRGQAYRELGYPFLWVMSKSLCMLNPYYAYNFLSGYIAGSPTKAPAYIRRHVRRHMYRRILRGGKP